MTGGTAAVVASLGEGSVAVLGAGPDAEALRAQLRDRGPATGERPANVVLVGGAQDEIAEALAAVEDLGTVLLAGPLPAELVDLDCYRDLHVRGLTLAGVALPEAGV